MFRIRPFLADRRGNIVVPGAMVFVTALGLAGAGIDMARVSMQRAELQSIADAAALAAIQEMAISKNNAERIEFVASAQVHLRAAGKPITPAPVADLDTQRLTLTARMPVKTLFPGPFSSMDQISVTATAELSGEAGNVCLIGLSDGIKRTIEMNNSARLTAQKCAIYSNSTDKESMYVNSTADIVAELIYLAGGFSGKPDGTLSEPVTDAAPIDDPLAGRLPPDFDDDCDHSNRVVTGSQTLSGGVYCGGLTVDGGSVDLLSGTYILKDGPLTVTRGGTLRGDHVGFYLTGDAAKLDFQPDSNIFLTAPKSGEMTGLLAFADPANSTVSRTKKSGRVLKDGHYIGSNNARRLVGTLYLPDDKLIVDGTAVIADQSEYTVIVAKAFELNDGPNLVIRTDYHLSDIPVPDGVGPMVDVETRLIR